jgi:hypothetical protein
MQAFTSFTVRMLTATQLLLVYLMQPTKNAQLKNWLSQSVQVLNSGLTDAVALNLGYTMNFVDGNNFDGNLLACKTTKINTLTVTLV